MAGSWRDQVEGTEEERRLLPRGYDVVGHVVVVRLPPEVDADLKARAGRALLEAVPNAATAAADAGVTGDLRTRRITVLAGEDRLVTEHRENGLSLLVDLATCYYSPRLAGERGRVADLVVEGERVLDLYCGVGPYTVLLARRGATVLGLELNRAAAVLARENARRNKVAHRVGVVHADAPRLTQALPPVVDRLVLNLPHDAVDHLAAALPAAAPHAVLHVGAMLPKDDAEARADAIAGRHGLALERLVHVRNYNPAVGHYTLDLVVGDLRSPPTPRVRPRDARSDNT